jgi:hypothetical protein
MKSDLVMAVNQICAEKDLPRNVILEAIEEALVHAYRRNFAANTAVVRVQIDPEMGDIRVFCEGRGPGGDRPKSLADAAQQKPSSTTRFCSASR